MEVRGQKTDNLSAAAKQRFDELRLAIARRDASRVRQARETLHELSQRRQEILRSSREEAVRRVELAQQSRGDLEASRTRSSERGRDTLEISDEARVAAEAAQAGSETDRSERVVDLRRAYQAGELNTPERIERAATRLLGAE